MSNYRRLYVPGGTYFFTVRLQDRRSDLLVKEVALLRHATALAMKQWPFQIPAAVVLPNRTHMIWKMPDDDADFSKRWRLIKSTFSRHLPVANNLRPSLLRKGEKGIWQRRFWEHLIRDETDYAAHLNMIHNAPVQEGLMPRPEDWSYSSARRFDPVKCGFMPAVLQA